MKDIIIPYLKNGSGELYTCIKLIDKNFSHRKTHVIEQFNDKAFGTLPHIHQILKLKWAIENLDITDEFYLFNDDFFVMDKVKGVDYHYRSTLEEHIESRRTNDFYTRSLIETSKLLGNGALSYELHLPFLFDKIKLWNDIKELQPLIENQTCPLIRSYYGNKHNVGGTQRKDVKNVYEYRGETFLSTTEASFKRGEIGSYIRSMA